MSQLARLRALSAASALVGMIAAACSSDAKPAQTASPSKTVNPATFVKLTANILPSDFKPQDRKAVGGQICDDLAEGLPDGGYDNARQGLTTVAGISDKQFRKVAEYAVDYICPKFRDRLP